VALEPASFVIKRVDWFGLVDHKDDADRVQ